MTWTNTCSCNGIRRQRWRLEAGVRNSVVDVASDDHLIEAGAPPYSGVRYDSANPVAGLTYRAGVAPGSVRLLRQGL